MKTVIFDVASNAEIARRFVAASKGRRQPPRISFASPDLLISVLTERRRELLRAIGGAGPMSLREAARRVGRDVKQVHGDAHALLNAGVLNKAEDGKIEFPYDAIHVEFELKAA